MGLIVGSAILSLFFISSFQSTPEKDAQEAIKDTTICSIQLVRVPSGKYKKGLDFKTDTIPYDYWIGKYEITNTQFVEFINSALKNNFIQIKNKVLYYQYPGDELVAKAFYKVRQFDKIIYLRNDSIILNPHFANHPATGVTWFGARAFCNFYGFRLPSEPEWEKAARGEKEFWFPWGNEIDSTYANYFNSHDPFEPGTTPVGFYNGQKCGNFQTSKAMSVYGCYDMAGNAWEWLEDRWTATTPYNKGKGGGFAYHTPAFLQIYYTSSFGPSVAPDLDMCHISDGFRVVKKLTND
ncbi:MAG: SUMF1/EgtB/PvdO family nonheme iron enzyme [Bacteroidia bacterium]|nr:SUMF1/EgtB/PvdO family nonheme iron enzyme [Bacteroidia bacterium]